MKNLTKEQEMKVRAAHGLQHELKKGLESIVFSPDGFMIYQAYTDEEGNEKYSLLKGQYSTGATPYKNEVTI